MSQPDELPSPNVSSQSINTSSQSIEESELDAHVFMHEALDLIDENPIIAEYALSNDFKTYETNYTVLMGTSRKRKATLNYYKRLLPP